MLDLLIEVLTAGHITFMHCKFYLADAFIQILNAPPLFLFFFILYCYWRLAMQKCQFINASVLWWKHLMQERYQEAFLSPAAVLEL